MNSREIVLANINRDSPPRCGLDFDRGRISDIEVATLTPRNYRQKRWLEGAIEYYDDEWGNTWHRMKDGSFKGEIIRPFLQDWSALPRLHPPDYSHPDCVLLAREPFSQSADKFRLVYLGGWVFNDARYLRNMAAYFMDMVEHQGELLELHDKIARVYEQKIHLAAQSGADGIFVVEDLGTQTGLLFSPQMFRFYFKERYARLFDLAHSYNLKVFFHSCGKNWAILPDLLDIGVNVFQFDQPLIYDLPALADLLRQRNAALWSPLDIQVVLPKGNRDLIRDNVARMYNLFKGGLIFKNYLDLAGIGVREEWDDWAYQAVLEKIILEAA